MTREEYILAMRPVPKPSTTSRCTTGDGGVTPTRADDDIKRRELQARLNAPTPTEVAANAWETYEAGWKARIAESDRRDRETMARRIKQDEQAVKDAATRQAKATRTAPLWGYGSA